MSFKKFTTMFGIASMLVLSGCKIFQTSKYDAIINTKDRCYILQGYTIQMGSNNTIWWFKPFNFVTGDRKNLMTFSGNYSISQSRDGELFSQKEFIQNAKLIGIDDISKCVEMN